MPVITEIISQRHYKEGYVVRREMLRLSEDEQPIEMRNAYTPEGHYIGEPSLARFLYVKRGLTLIQPRKGSTSGVVQVGFCPHLRKWFGWSRRAICGFGVGDYIFEENFGDDNTSFKKHGSKEIVTLEDAYIAACNFAKFVA